MPTACRLPISTHSSHCRTTTTRSKLELYFYQLLLHGHMNNLFCITTRYGDSLPLISYLRLRETFQDLCTYYKLTNSNTGTCRHCSILSISPPNKFPKQKCKSTSISWTKHQQIVFKYEMFQHQWNLSVVAVLFWFPHNIRVIILLIELSISIFIIILSLEQQQFSISTTHKNCHSPQQLTRINFILFLSIFHNICWHFPIIFYLTLSMNLMFDDPISDSLP